MGACSGPEPVTSGPGTSTPSTSAPGAYWRSSVEALNQNHLMSSRFSYCSDKAPLDWLVGTWKGKGKGIFPTIKDFEYAEECTFTWDPSNPRPLLFYKQKTFSTVGDPPRPMHVEAGFMRVISQVKSDVVKAELIVSAPNGVATIEEGFVEGHTIKLKTTSVTRSSTSRAPYAIGLERTYTVDPNSCPPTLHYVIDMATSTCPTMTRHLEAVLTKWDEGDDDDEDEFQQHVSSSQDVDLTELMQRSSVGNGSCMHHDRAVDMQRSSSHERAAASLQWSLPGQPPECLPGSSLTQMETRPVVPPRLAGGSPPECACAAPMQLHVGNGEHAQLQAGKGEHARVMRMSPSAELLRSHPLGVEAEEEDEACPFTISHV